MEFAGGETQRALEAVGTVGKTNTGTWLRFWPDPKYFSKASFRVPALKRVLRAKALLCPGLTVSLIREADGSTDEWQYEDGLAQYLTEQSGEENGFRMSRCASRNWMTRSARWIAL